MTPEAQRIAIAEACGWKITRHLLPDYLNDLNACHEAEKTLNEDEQESYAHELSQIIPQRYNCGPIEAGGDDIMVHREFDLLHATAAQRAEAFLRAKGLWTDAPTPTKSD